ncbi:MAG: 3'(2'),5'-bisphosphate nucleotidase CysQ [Phenylobacterium sp.]
MTVAAILETTDLELIVDAAHEAGELAGVLRRRGLEIEYKAGDSTPVTNADLAADALLTERLRTARPEYGWLSEETADDPDRLARRRLFVVDPIDGTRAFLNDKPWWAVSIAVVEGSRPTAGVVFAPQLAETYAAAAGAGATLNGRPIHASATTVLEDSGMVADPRLFTLPRWREPWPPMRVAQRNSTAYRMCLVASGAFDAAVTLMSKHDWDLAAADLIAGEAGCFVGDASGAAFVYNGVRPVQANLICAAPGLAPLILERVSHIAAPT